jgi:hypothetical protein
MKWDDIRRQYPDQWLLLEAIKAYSVANKRILDQIAVLNSYPDSVTAMKGYKELHQEAPQRELYVFHTSREQLDITERQWFGIRGGI